MKSSRGSIRKAVVVSIDGGETLAALDLGNYRGTKDSIAGEAGFYNVLITAFNTDQDYIDNNIFDERNDVIYDKSTDKKYEVPEYVAFSDPRSGRTVGTSSDTSIRSSSKKSNRKNSERDREYMEAVNSGNTAKAQRMVDEAARQAGYTKLFYHGSKKGGGFTVFKDWQYFTENKDYAKRYTQRDNPGSLYTVYAKMEHPFDTRDAEAEEIFANARQELGLGEIQESGLPDRGQSVMIDIKNTRPHFGTACFVLFIPVICRRRSIPELWSI